MTLLSSLFLKNLQKNPPTILFLDGRRICQLNLLTLPASGSSFFVYKLAILAHLSEAFAAVHGSVRSGLKGNLCFATASSAGSGEVLSGATGGILSSVTASLAALGLILEASFSIEFLLTGGEHELVATVFAN